MKTLSTHKLAPRALICEPQDEVRGNIAAALSKVGLEPIEASTSEETLAMFYQATPDIVILAEELEPINGSTVCGYMRGSKSGSNTPIIMIGELQNISADQAFEQGVSDFVAKPVNMPVLAHKVLHTLDTSRVLRQKDHELNFLSNYDALTGLPNRQSFTKQLAKSLSVAKTESKKSCLMLIDFDNFKRINDNLGHAGGDQLLKKIGQRLAMSLRSTDLLMRESSDGELCEPELARLGGDEFIIYLDGVESHDAIVNIARRNLEAICQPLRIKGQDVVVTPSIGVAVYPDNGRDVHTLMSCAERAMYAAKKQGGASYKFYDGELNADAKSRLKLEADLRNAIANDQLELYFQPQVDSMTGEVFCFEALCRWQHPELGMVPPDMFIPLAEETGQITHIGDWVLRTACRQAKHWLDEGLPLNRVAVNVSAYQFHRPDFFQNVVDVLNECKLSPKYLELELTESIVMSDAEDNIRKLNLLKTVGISLAIDDFGTGYSSLSYLKRFPIDTLKIDRSFISNIANEKTDSAIVKAIIALAESLQLKVVAEGVEDHEQLAFLKKHRCDLVQGYYFSKAKPAVEVSTLLGTMLDCQISA